ncbi:MAG: hypothetical protein ACI8W8_002151 [Rhodothermales bacterium]|jgi:hypothetical protein
MIFFLKLVAVAVVVILLIIGVVVLIARIYFRRLENMVSGLTDLDLPDFRRKLRPASSIDWQEPEVAEDLQKALESEGFRVIGDFEDEMGCLYLRGYINAEKRASGVIIKDSEQFGVELCRDYEDGSRVSVSSLPVTLLSAATGAKIIHKPDASVAELAKLLILEAPALDLAVLPEESNRQAFASRYETVYAHRMNAVIDRGGPTIGEIRSHVIAQGKTCDEEEAGRVRSRWLRHISLFFSSKQLARYRQLSGDNEEHEHMMLAVHDRMYAEDILDALGEYNEFFDAIEDTAEVAEQESAVEAIKALLQDAPPRQVFRDYLAATGQDKQFSFVQEVDKPIPGDIWRIDDWDGGFDEELDDFTT